MLVVAYLLLLGLFSSGAVTLNEEVHSFISYQSQSSQGKWFVRYAETYNLSLSCISRCVYSGFAYGVLVPSHGDAEKTFSFQSRNIKLILLRAEISDGATLQWVFLLYCRLDA